MVFILLRTLEFFVIRKMEMSETKLKDELSALFI